MTRPGSTKIWAIDFGSWVVVHLFQTALGSPLGRPVTQCRPTGSTSDPMSTQPGSTTGLPTLRPTRVDLAWVEPGGPTQVDCPTGDRRWVGPRVTLGPTHEATQRVSPRPRLGHLWVWVTPNLTSLGSTQETGSAQCGPTRHLGRPTRVSTTVNCSLLARQRSTERRGAD